jgi:hypothetical protein
LVAGWLQVGRKKKMPLQHLDKRVVERVWKSFW